MRLLKVGEPVTVGIDRIIAAACSQFLFEGEAVAVLVGLDVNPAHSQAAEATQLAPVDIRRNPNRNYCFSAFANICVQRLLSTGANEGSVTKAIN